MSYYRLKNIFAIMFFMLAFTLTSCDEDNDNDNEPVDTNATVATSEASAVNETSATIGGTFTTDSDDVTETGIEYKKEGSASFSAIAAPEVSSPFSVTLTDLEKDTDYIYKAYLKTAKGTIFGAEKKFKTTTSQVFLNQIVDHTNIDAIKSTLEKNSQLVDRIGKQRWFFAHASVGSEMAGDKYVEKSGKSGLTMLHDENASIFKLIPQAVAENQPLATTQGGVVYEYNRGNPDWATKIAYFEGYMEVWESKIDVAFNKFCWIDKDAGKDNAAGADHYIESMQKLESKYPNVKFVYATMPLSIKNDENILRWAFNTKVRRHCANNNRLLLDIADIQSHKPNGEQVTFTSEGKTYESLYTDYTYDEGHLSDIARKRMGLAWYAIAAAISGI